VDRPVKRAAVILGSLAFGIVLGVLLVGPALLR
jgi:hypothetical protein